MGEKIEVPLVIYLGENTRHRVGTAWVDAETGLMGAEITDQLFIEHLNQDMLVEPDPFQISANPRESDPMANEFESGPLGSRTQRPHHPDGWDAKRENKEEPAKGDAPKRGTLRSGVHDRSEADK